MTKVTTKYADKLFPKGVAIIHTNPNAAQHDITCQCDFCYQMKAQMFFREKDGEVYCQFTDEKTIIPDFLKRDLMLDEDGKVTDLGKEVWADVQKWRKEHRD